MAPIIDCHKSKMFTRIEAQQRSFEAIKVALSLAPILAFLDFDKPFHVDIEASMVGIGVVLMQEARPIECFQ